jgi:hypothetical protein
MVCLLVNTVSTLESTGKYLVTFFPIVMSGDMQAMWLELLRSQLVFKTPRSSQK